MTISELKRTVNFIKQNVISGEIPQKFSNLVNVLQANARVANTGQQPQPITTQKAALIAAIKGTQINGLTLNEQRLLGSFIDLNLLGERGVEKINQIFSEHNLDPMGAVNAFSHVSNYFATLIEAANNTIKALAPIDATIADVEIEEGKAVLQINFKDKASITNVTLWREHSDDWWQIIRSVGLLTDTTADDAKVLSFQQGSVIVEVSACYMAIKAVGLMADKTLNVIERLLDLRKKTLEIKQLQLSNKKIETELEREAETFIESQTKLIGAQVIEAINKEMLKNGEVVAAMNVAVDKLFKFLDQGGTVDCRLKQIEKQPAEAVQIKEDFSKIRRLENRVQQLKLLTDGEKEKE